MLYPHWSLWAPLGALALGFLASGCSDPPAKPRPNVLVITVDSLRADHLGCYGYERATSPNLDRLATESVVFENACTHAPFTAPSHASLLTSLNIKSHGVHAWGEALADNAHNLAERLEPFGYRTGAFYNHPGLVTSNVTRGFDTVSERTFEEAPRTADDFLQWVDQGGEQPFATWLHLWDVHRPYGYRDWTPDFYAERVERDELGLTLAYEETRFGQPTPPTTVEFGRTEAHYNLNGERIGPLLQGKSRAQLRTDLEYVSTRYDGGVFAADAGVGLIIDGLRARGLLDNTLLVITADHGEALLERDACYFTHDPFLYQETLHVPLIVRFPNGEYAGTRIADLARHVDVIPTIHQVADLAMLGDEQGRSLVPVVAGTNHDRALLLAETKTRSAKETSAKLEPKQPGWLENRVALTDGHYKLIHDRSANTWQFFDLSVDPNERQNLANEASHADTFSQWKALLASYQAAWPEAGDTSAVMNADTENLLGTIGYL